MTSIHRPTSQPEKMSMEVFPGQSARQIDLVNDRASLLTLGRRCEEYITLALGRKPPPGKAGDTLVRMLTPRTVPRERSFVFGLYPEQPEGSHGVVKPHDLQGVLYFLHPPPQGGTWFLTLMLLAPAARGRGLGLAFHQAFARWAEARGADRLVVAVAENNPRARNFWETRAGYTPVAQTHGANPEFELRLGVERPR